MYYFCTYFDQGYLSRGLALYESLKTHCSAFELWILCMDSQCYEYLKSADLPGIKLISLEEFECGDARLLAAKANRKLIEYYFTCTPSLPLFILKREPRIDVVTYLDADLYFFADPRTLYEELGDASIGITEHRFAAELSYKRKYGIYNVAYLSFRRDADGIACLNWWRDRCIEWCYDRLEGDRFADQKYLDRWPELWPSLVVLQHKGANLAPWNVSRYRITIRNNRVMVDDEQLIFFHFHLLKRLGNWLFEPNLFKYKVTPSRVVLKHIYKPYVRKLARIERKLQELGQSGSNALRSFIEPSSIQQPSPLHKPGRITGQIKWFIDTCHKVYERRYILVLGRRSF